MAGRVRQPIDVPALEKYLSKNEPRIKVPLEIKQVLTLPIADSVTWAIF
jgi:hypothetical protein